ncbi:MAG: DUF5689 domain-containing protein, partial [Rikenellaceae bacterium]|nr:DUF5689 domain-containing protein [Rikenellaceae bacterium]
MAELKAMAAGTITQDVRVTVSVVSDFMGGNYPSTNMICVQDATRGFRLVLPAANTYAFGQSLIVVLRNATMTKTGQSLSVCTVTPASAAMIVPVGAPDPAIQPVVPSGAAVYEYSAMLVTIPTINVSEADRLKKFDGPIVFDIKGSATTKVTVQTNATAEWKGAYIPTATGSVVGVMTDYASNNITIYPRHTADLSGLPVEG